MSGAAASGGPERFRRVLWGAFAWVAILVAIGVVQLVREQWFDASVFLVVAGVLSFDAGRRRPPVERATSSLRTRHLASLGLVGLLVAGAIALFLPRHGIAMQALVCAIGLTVLWASWRRGVEAGGWSPSAKRLARAWALIVVAGCLWELGEFLVGLAHPDQPAFALSDLLDPLLSTPLGQGLFVVAWIAGGCFLVSRSRR